MQLSEEQIKQRLDAWPVARLATVGPEGLPHQVPIVFARVGDTLWSPIDGKPKLEGAARDEAAPTDASRSAAERMARVRNLRANPAAHLLLDAYHDDWEALWWISIAAHGDVVRAAGEDDPAVAPALAALRAKYPQYASTPLSLDTPTLLAFRIAGIKSWCANPS